MFEADRIEVSVSSAVVTSLMHGSILWKDTMTPSGLASTVLSSLDIVCANTLHKGIVLDYSTKYEMSAVSLEKLTKTQVVLPKDITGMLDRVNALYCLIVLFFGKLSHPEQGLKKFINRCESNRQLLRTNLFMDYKFIARVLYSIDNRLFIWLSECKNAKSVTDTNLDLISFGNIISELQLGTLRRNLPEGVMKPISSAMDDDNKRRKDENDKSKKQRC